MSRPSRPALIGGFVLGAVALAVIAALVFGSGRFLRETVTCVMYFEEPVSGLDVGAPVEYRGVRLGGVSSIQLVYDPKLDAIVTPVLVELIPDQIAGLKRAAGERGEGIAEAVVRGLRAQLRTQSLLTGKLKIELSFRPDTQGLVLDRDHTFPQIPTISGPLDAFAKKLQGLPLEQMVFELSDAIQGVSEMVNSGEIRSAISNLNETLASSRIFMSNSVEKLEALPLEQMAADVSTALRQISDTLEQTDLSGAVSNLNQTLLTGRRFMDSADERISPLRYETLQALEELRRAAASLRHTADYIQRHPESLLHGKSEEEP